MLPQFPVLPGALIMLGHGCHIRAGSDNLIQIRPGLIQIRVGVPISLSYCGLKQKIK